MCLCSGSIQYVHEECVLEWITKKIEMADELEIPKCEICRSQYNAKLNVGQRKVCPDLLLNKLRELEVKEISHAVVYLLGAVVALWVAVNAVIAQVSSLWQVYEGQETVPILEEIRGLKIVFTDFVFPFIFLRSGVEFISNYRFIWEESEVQMVELVLTPRLILKD